MTIAAAHDEGRQTALVIERATRLRGSPRLPGDKSISHRAVMLGLLSAGPTSISGLSDGADVRSTADIARALGAEISERVDAGGTRCVDLTSPGIDGLRAPFRVLDCGNSGTSLRLYAGILAGQPFESVLDGDESLRSRPVARIIEPLRAMGADVGGRRDDTLPPVTVRGRRDLRAIEWTPSVPSAQVKSAILLAGLRAAGTVTVHESVATRDHTERMLRSRGVEVTTTEGLNGWTIELEGGQRMEARDELVPRDPSAAAFWLVAGAIHPDADLRLDGVGLNARRRAAIDLLRRMGAVIEGPGDGGHEAADGEPQADLRVRSSELRGIDVSPAETAAAIDEIPILALAATQASGRTAFRGAGELRHKESDRIGGIVAGLRALGGVASVDGDDILVDGPAALRGATVDGLGDHRLVMTFAIAGLVASGRTTVRGAGSAAISDPGFIGQLDEVTS